MGWLIGIGAVLVIIYFMIVSPGFRGLMLFLLVAGGLLIWYLVDKNSKEAERNEQQRLEAARRNAVAVAAAREKIKETDLVLNNLTLTKGSRTWDFKGMVLNNSTHTLKSVNFAIVMKDCPTADSCITIGQDTSTASFEGVPTSQARGFAVSFAFKDMPDAKRLSWSYSITGIMAAY